MALDLPLASVVRISTGLLLGGLGAIILAMRPAEPRARWLALWFIALTPVSILVSLRLAGDGSLRGAAAIGSTFAVLVGVFALSMHLREDAREGGAPARRVIAICAGIGALAAAGMLSAFAIEPEVEIFLAVEAVARALLGCVAFLYARRARGLLGVSPQAVGFGWLAFGLSLFPVASPALSAAGAARTDGPFAFAGLLLPILVVLATAIELTRLGIAARPLPLVAAIAIPGVGLTGLAVGALVTTDVVGTRGVVRGISLPIMAYAIFRYDLLRSGRHPKWASRAAVAPSLLAVLFITAQIAQNFLSSQYGLLMGGIVAGALLVAARPIERALEARNAERRAPASADNERTYRLALRAALADGAMTGTEEEHLAELAEHLAIPARTALRLRREVERERDHTS